MKANEKKRSVTPEVAQDILLKNGVQVNLAKAALVLDFLYLLANLEVNKNDEK